jgi:hypothetical protein
MDKPILFSAPMVRALLEGRKTMTRRVIKLPTKGEYIRPDMGGWAASTLGGGGCFRISKDGTRTPVAEHPVIWNQTTGTCLAMKYEVGDRLWVREAWRTEMSMDAQPPKHICPGGYGIHYEADTKDHATWGKLRPSIFMCQWMSRITLDVTGVKIERLQDISEADAKAEGLAALTKDGTLVKYGIADSDGLPGNDDCGWSWHEWSVDPRQAFAHLWKSINGEGSWDANPWIAAYSFKRVDDAEHLLATNVLVSE